MDRRLIKARPPGREYTSCPLCGSRQFHMGAETLSVPCKPLGTVEVRVRRWKCEQCGESVLTAKSRLAIDEACGLAREQ